MYSNCLSVFYLEIHNICYFVVINAILFIIAVQIKMMSDFSLCVWFCSICIIYNRRGELYFVQLWYINCMHPSIGTWFLILFVIFVRSYLEGFHLLFQCYTILAICKELSTSGVYLPVESNQWLMELLFFGFLAWRSAL